MKKKHFLSTILLVFLALLLVAPTAFANTSSWIAEIPQLQLDQNKFDPTIPALPAEGQEPSTDVSTEDGPVITEQPINTDFNVPYSVELSVGVEQPEKCDFQWQYRDLDSNEFFNLQGSGAKKQVLHFRSTNFYLEDFELRCVVTYKDQPHAMTVSDSAKLILKSMPKNFAVIGDTILPADGKMYAITDGEGSAGLSADGKTLTLKDVTVSSYSTLGVGPGPDDATTLAYYTTPTCANDIATIKLEGENTLFQDNSKGYPEKDGVNVGFANIFFQALNVPEFENDPMTLNFEGSGSINLTTNPIQKNLFQYYGIYARNSINIKDNLKFNIENSYRGISCADFTLGKNVKMNLFNESLGLDIWPNNSADARGNVFIGAGSELTAQSIKHGVISLLLGGSFTAEDATLNLTNKTASDYDPKNPEPLYLSTIIARLPSDPVEGKKSDVTLKNCRTTINIDSDYESSIFQQGISANGDLTIDGGFLNITSKFGENAVNNSGSIGIQAKNINMLNNAKSDINVSSSNFVVGTAADKNLTVTDASLNTVIDNSQERFDKNSEALGIGGSDIAINLTNNANKVSSKVINYDNSLAIAGFLENSDDIKNYDPAYQASKITLKGKAEFLTPAAKEAVLNQASVEAHQIGGEPSKKYDVFETVYNKNNTSKAVKDITIGVADTPPVPVPVAVTGVTLDKTSAEMKAKETLALKATIQPENATNKNVAWSSSDSSIATVDKNGTVTAIKSGKTIITVTTEDGGKTAQAAITVKDTVGGSNASTGLSGTTPTTAVAVILLCLGVGLSAFVAKRKR